MAARGAGAGDGRVLGAGVAMADARLDPGRVLVANRRERDGAASRGYNRAAGGDGEAEMTSKITDDEAEDEIDPLSLPLIPLLPSAITAPDSGRGELARLVGAEIVRIGTTTPGLIEGGGLIIDYRRPDGCQERIVLAFSERGMWIEQHWTRPG